ncbi:MAG: nicotinamide riboside transporter PnuC [Gemmataceae bacterium]|nr:nicotinamide riboside transporter PnuC [Gemmataceae bacterium]
MPIDFDSQILGMSVLELVAALFGVVSVGLTVKQSVWGWPVGVVMVALYAVIFWRERLYADSGLQVVYFVLQIYGWYQWLHGGSAHDRLPVSRASGGLMLLLMLLGAVGSAGLGTALARWTNQDMPYLDSTIAAFSLVAQWMLARKLLQNWLLWIGVDLLAVGVYAAKGLYPTVVLYAIFLFLAAAGYVEWQRSLCGTAREESADTVPAVEKP